MRLVPDLNGRRIIARAVAASQRTAKRFGADNDGATAIEFAIVAIPFFTLIFGILELALVFFVGSVLSQAVSDTGRSVRVGAFQQCGGSDSFRKVICDQMKGLMNCERNLRIDLATGTTFQTITLEDPGMSGTDGTVAADGSSPQANNGPFAETTAEQPVVLRATFYYPLVLPAQVTRLESVPGSGRHILTATTAFRNEPFPNEPCRTNIPT